MAQQTSDLSSLSEAQRYVIFQCVFEYISDIRILKSLTLVSKETRTAVYRSNGLRVLTLRYHIDESPYLNRVKIKGENQEGKLRDGLRWIWTVGQRLKSVCLDRYPESRCFCDILLPMYKSLATTEKRRIETLAIRGGGMHCELAFSLLRENRNTLRRLCVILCNQRIVDTFCSSRSSMTRFSFSEPTESESFFSLLQQSERLESLDLRLRARESPIFPVDFVHFVGHTQLKHLGLILDTDNGVTSTTEVIREIVDVLSVENLRENLESLQFGFPLSMSFLYRLVEKLAEAHTPVVFVNVTEIFFDFLGLCCQPDPINWLAFWTVFPAVKGIKNCFSVYPEEHVQQSSALSQSLANLCKTYLEVCASRACDIKVNLPVPRPSRGERKRKKTKRLRAVIAEAVALPEDQDWCASHSVQIETETRDEKVQKVTLRKDTATLVFHFV